MFGLRKPSTHRGFRSGSRRNPAVNPNAGSSGESLFISSYHDDKIRKHQQQTKEMILRLLKFITLAGIIFAVAKSQQQSSLLAESEDAASVLRGGINANEMSTTKTVSDSSPKSEPAKPPEPEFKGPYCTPIDNAPDANKGSDKPANIEIGSDDSICGRKIPINLAEESKKPIPPLGPDGAVPNDNKEVVLIKKVDDYGGRGSQLISFFRSFDYAYENKKPFYITQDSKVLDTLFPFFFGPQGAVEKNALLWNTIEHTLGIKVIENEGVLELSGLTADPKLPNFIWYHAKGLEDAKIRDHRTSILRRLFHYPSQRGSTKENVCSVIDTLLGKEKDKKYTVIHITKPRGNSFDKWKDKFNGGTGKDHTAAYEMKPEYVKSILKKTDMLKHDIYPIGFRESGNVDYAVHTGLVKDADLTSQLKCIKDENKSTRNEGGNLYLAVLADVYIGSPYDQMSLWIARMRFALGMKNTFIFMEKKGDDWVSYMNEENYLELYEQKKLGLWMA